MAAVAAVVVAFVPVWWCGWAWLRVRGEGFEGALACRKVAEALGSASMVLLGLALLPTARRSFVLKALGVPYERSVAMHSAAATGMTACGVLHGLAFLALWSFQQTAPTPVTSCKQALAALVASAPFRILMMACIVFDLSP